MEIEIEIWSMILRRIPQVLAVGCFFAGVIFLAWPKAWVQKTNHRLSKWYSTKHIEDSLNAVFQIDEQLLRIRKVLSFISLAVGFILVYMCFKI